MKRVVWNMLKAVMPEMPNGNSSMKHEGRKKPGTIRKQSGNSAGFVAEHALAIEVQSHCSSGLLIWLVLRRLN
jgi:hypothetical protein